ncbi:MAG: Crp/Fnr family transcriptional regulator [Candidatus Promineifilaceae bacterium]
MVSTELLRRYPFFAGLIDDQLRELAMITEEIEIQKGDTLFEGGSNADFLYLLQDGGIDLHYVVVDDRGMETPQDFMVGVINPREVFGISSLIKPFKYTASAVVNRSGSALQLDGLKLRALCEEDEDMYVILLERIASTALLRLRDTRLQLVV